MPLNAHANSCGSLVQEAEDGVLSGTVAIGSDPAASGGQYMHVPNGTGNSGVGSSDSAAYCFHVTTPGRYRIKGWVHAETWSDDSFFVRVDGLPAAGYLWDTPLNTAYGLDYVSDRDGDNPVEVLLSAGEHTVIIWPREDGTRLDKIELELIEAQAPPSTCAGLVQEAEAGTLSGTVAVGNDATASGGQYVYAPNGSGNSEVNSPNFAEYCFSVTAPGLYRIKGWVHAETGQDDSFYVQVDGAPSAGYLWDTRQNTAYDADYVGDRNGGDPIEVFLSTGGHTVIIWPREDGTRLDKIELEWVEAQEPPSACGGLMQEAEDGMLSGAFTVGNDAAASGAQYVHVPNGSGNSGVGSSNSASYCFNVTNPGRYRIKGWVHAETWSDDSFFVQVDSLPASAYLWDTPLNTAYALDYVSHRDGDDPVEVNLSAGEHTIIIGSREDGTRLDKIELEWVAPPGTTTVAVPNVVGQTETVALDAVLNAGLAIGSLQYEHHATVTGGTVISQSPAPGTTVETGSAVNLAVSLGPLPPITLTLLSVADGDTVAKPDILIHGTFIHAQGYETGITVNGIPACVVGNEFAVNHLPLEEGANTLTIEATDITGYTERLTLTIHRVPSEVTLDLTASQYAGLFPLESIITVEQSFDLTDLTLNVSGPGHAIVTEAPEAGQYRIDMPAEGIYLLTAEARDEADVVYTDTIAFAVWDRAALDALLRSKWEGMKQQLTQQDIGGALSFFAANTRAPYQDIYSALSAQLPQIVQAMQDIELIDVQGHLAKYRIRRQEIHSGQVYLITYYLYFSVDKDGLWKILRY
ncbi:PASTA domain-containing protein [Candidatus Entotheonella palauensis]|uniref:PASTA domain-containing protein n=1 Tax=Candidatus Entotheonella palauensis TaxID=93172 RepID=UPI0015C497A5|nr:PASTA domain-containing protein [Candidatus Entotheonella palauensis]